MVESRVRRGHGRMIVDPLNDLLPSLMLEIDVDIRRFVTFGGDESFEQEGGQSGIDGRHAKDETHG